MKEHQSKEEKKYEQWIRAMFNKYKGRLFIEKYHLKMKRDDEESYLASKFNYPYLDIEIIYTKKAMDDWKKDDKDAERRVIHEFCHTITDQFYAVVLDFPSKRQLEDQRERLTDHIAQIVNKHFNLI